MNIKQISQTVFVKGRVQKASVILIPGSSEINLAEEAAKLYHSGYANKIVVSGGYNKKLPYGVSEAEYLRDYLLSMGVSSTSIYLDTKASNTQENAQNSKIICEALNIKNSAIIVCKNYHAGRVKKTYEKYFITGCKLYIYSVIDSRNVLPNAWDKNEASMKIVMNEYNKIKKYFPHENVRVRFKY